ncbi:MAG TPA: type III pantothenate kinase [Desulfonatronum sp.]|nr:type III pantothenate kinase [Desulfonatronum sp.]
MSNILLFDVGNTNTKIGVARNADILGAYSLPTHIESTSDAWGLWLLQILALHGLESKDVSSWIAASVVPPVSLLLRKAGERFCKCPVLFVPEDIPLPLENRYGRPNEVGADRLVGAYAARGMFSSRSLIIVDFGTATTFDCVQDHAYLGGLICPGLQSSAAALSTKTAKLPSISLEDAPAAPRIGRSTSESLRHGLIFGFAAMVDGLCRRLKEQLPHPVEVIATGGPARPLLSVCAGIDHNCPDLLLQGLLRARLEHAHQSA